MTRQPRILIINPVTYSTVAEAVVSREIAQLGLEGFTFEWTFIDQGLPSIESVYDEVLNGAGILAKVRWAGERGFDGIVVNCFAGPAVGAARELADVPVVDPGEASMHLACMLGGKFSILTILRDTQRLMGELVRRHGVEGFFASSRPLGLEVLELEADPARAVEVAEETALQCVQQDGASVLILGCTGMAGLAIEIQDRLRSKGVVVPVLDPFRVAVHTCAAMVRLGVSHSRHAYYPPRAKRAG